MAARLSDVDAYLRRFPPNVRARLEALRRTIRAAAPDAEEIFAYGLPGYRFHGPLVYFGGFQDHCSLYAGGRTRELLSKRTARYAGGKGTLRFPHDQRLPLSLVRAIVRQRVRENQAKPARPARDRNARAR